MANATGRSCLKNGDMVLNGRYEILKCIHSRGMANVYLVMDTNLGKQWCLKEIRKSEAGKKNIEYISLLQEANILRGLNHERIPRITAIDDEGDSLFVVMDFLDGVTLKSYIEERGKVPEQLAVQWMLQITQIMGYLHSKTQGKNPIFFRDMKPDNLMVRSNGNINIFDFGISIEVKHENQLPDYTLGTAGYVAPEQKKKDLPVDLRSDIYSMGLVFYYILTGVDPRNFKKSELKPISEWSPEISPALSVIVEKCYNEAPADRFQSCEELQYALENYQHSDAAYKASAKKKVNIAISVFALGALLVAGSSIPMGLNNVQRSDKYNQAVAVAEQTGRSEDYEAAISLEPANIGPYNGYIEALKLDGVFSVDEERTLLSFVNPNLVEIKSQKDYGEFAYNMGKLYWFYYQNNSAESSAEVLSIKWFEDAITQGYKVEESRVYYNMGKFRRDITKSILEANDNGMYKEYWDNLLSVQSTENVSDIVTIQVSITIAECISNYGYNLKKDGVSYDEVIRELGVLKDFVQTYQVDDSTVDVIRNLYNELTNDLADLSERVKVLYGVV